MGARTTLAVATAATLVLMAASTMPYPLLEPFIVQRFASAVWAPALYVSVNLAAYVLLAPVAGALVDRARRRGALVAAGMALQAVMLAVQPGLDALSVLLAVRFVEGAGTVLALTALHASVLDTVGAPRRGLAMGSVGMGLALGVATGAALGGLLGERALALPFRVGAMALALSAPAALVLVRAGPEPPVGRATIGEAARVLAREPRLVVPAAFALLDRLTVGFFVTALPLHVAVAHGLGPGPTGALMATFLLVFGALQVPFGRLSDRFGRVPFVALGSVLYGGFLALVPVVGEAGLAPLMAAGGLVGAAMFAPAFAMVGDLAPGGRSGAAVALFHQAGSLGFAVGPLVGGAVLAAWGAGASFASIGALEVVAGLVLVVVARTGSLERPPGRGPREGSQPPAHGRASS